MALHQEAFAVSSETAPKVSKAQSFHKWAQSPTKGTFQIKASSQQPTKFNTTRNLNMVNSRQPSTNSPITRKIKSTLVSQAQSKASDSQVQRNHGLPNGRSSKTTKSTWSMVEAESIASEHQRPTWMAFGSNPQQAHPTDTTTTSPSLLPICD